MSGAPPSSAGFRLAAILLIVVLVVAGLWWRQRPDATAHFIQLATDSALARLAADAEQQAEVFDEAETQVFEESALGAPERDLDHIRFTLDARLDGTYLAELLAARDGWNYRWPERPGEPMRIWVQESPLPGFEHAHLGLVHDAFSAWSDAGVPLLFTFTPDSARATIRVTWVDRFEERKTGQTHWAHDQHGWIVRGTIELALHQPDGRLLGRDGVRAIARHEVGHLLGLDHVRDTTHVMAPQVKVTELSEADRRTIRLVYALPPGRITP
ncbi:MAG: matrixin family metalloprotease [Gemmatimonadaceae bacterium]